MHDRQPIGTEQLNAGNGLLIWQGPAILDVLEPIVEVYRDVFTAPPWNETEELVAAFVQRLRHECQRPGFVAVTAHEGGNAAGFATAWPTPPPFPSGRSYTAVANQFGEAWVNRWLVGAMEIDELAVSPRSQGQGAGGRLLDACVQAAPRQAAWLLTHDHAEDTVRFYRRRGWHAPPASAPDGSGVLIFLSPQHPARRQYSR